jgi:transcriptional regulator with XRE-family HTH domain
MLELYKNIRKFRNELRMSQAELAKRTGYNDRSSIAKIERGDVDLPQSKIILFANALNVSPGELMGSVEDDDRVQNIGHQKEYYENETYEMAQAIFDRPDLHALMKAAMDCDPDQIQSVADMLLRFKETNIDG